MYGDARIPISRLHVFENLQRGLRVCGALHINLDAVVQCRRLRGDLARQRKTQLSVEIESELRQLDRDISLDARFLQRTQDLQISFARLPRLFWCGDIFAQMVQDNGLAVSSQRRDRAKDFAECFSGYKPLSEAMLRTQAPDAIRYVFLCGEPEDQIAQRVRFICLFLDLLLRI